MRNALTTVVGMAFLLAVGCSTGGGSDGGTNGSNGTGNDGGLFGPGHICGGNNQCESNICGPEGTGHCCLSQCPIGSASDLCSIATDCDDTGKCIYPPLGMPCGTICTSDTETDKTCDGAGGCSNPKAKMCAPFGCAGGTLCATSCGDGGGCAQGFYCNNGSCVQQIDTGPCNGDNQVCSSGLCAPNGQCCRENCPHDKTPECVALACTGDAGGSCVYPSSGTICNVANETCSDSTLNAGLCDGMGTCNPASVPCPGGFACGTVAGTGCVLACGTDSNCALGYYCGMAGAERTKCVAQVADGGCAADDQCLTNVCGTAGSGNCCLVQCKLASDTGGDPACAATGCDGNTEACQYPPATTACGTPGGPVGKAMIALSCTGTTQTNPTLCDGAGTCDFLPNPATTSCKPFTCNGMGAGASCFKTCTGNSSCDTADNAFCDTTAKSCCPAIGMANAISVDGQFGKDAACCGFGANNPCQTITYAMKLIDAAQLTGVTINALVAGGAGNWPLGETYPIVLGWGVELNAQGVAFEDPNSVGNKGVVGTAIFDIKHFSTNDTVGYASIYGGAGANQVIIGMDDKQTSQSKDTSAILVEAGNTLYLASAIVNGVNSSPATAAITVQAGATLNIGEDKSTKNIGAVTIGAGTLSGGNGIVCGASGATKACTVTDFSLGMAGVTTLTIENQTGYDIDAEDMASISLTNSPVVGVAPKKPGFGQCVNNKLDGSSSGVSPAAILLRGTAALTFGPGTVQCITGAGFLLSASKSGPPTLTLEGTAMLGSTVTNTDVGVFASDGKATVTNTTFEFNYTGVEETTDVLMNSGTIDLSGGGNTVVCDSEKESTAMNQQVPGVAVLNTTSNALNASKTAWDTTGPDLFSCTNATLGSCTCESGVCTNTAAADGMDAVYIGSGTVTTTNGTQSPLAVTYSCK